MYTVEHPLHSFANIGLATTLSSGATMFHELFAGALNATENLRQAAVARDGTFRNGYVATSTAQPGTGSLVFTLRINSADATVVITVAAGSAAGTFTDLTNTSTATAGQLGGWKIKNNASSTSAALTGIGVYYHGTDAHYTQPKTVVAGVYNISTIAGSSGTLFEIITGSGTSATENTRQVIFPMAGTIKYAYLNTITTQPASGSLVRTLRKNGADQSIILTVAAGSTSGTFTDLTHTVSVSAGDLLNWKVVNNATVTSAQQIAVSFYFY
jgi:hypothetical protein